ncbi:DivIVA domain-containing protein [Rothia endophytica]|uniref:DivIVA domain-containing protein n=1 Tax=Rothia endophytica TaxID=1324766 RepID=UPI001F451E49|nr:DivIVA domain-containing protein [Rothia endophytica]
MALTPEEVINKRFQPTKFKEGYNPEEVDDFLDEIVIELRRLNAENSSLKRQHEEAEAQAPFTAAESPASTAPAFIDVPEAAPEVEVSHATPSDAAGLLALAQKVHDDYVIEGKRERERLIGEGQEEAANLVATAREESSQVLGELEQTKVELEQSVDQLRSFESTYRSSLRTYITEQLSALEQTPHLEPLDTPSPVTGQQSLALESDQEK